ncbi:MAG: phosphatidate cytidylyltransferase [bacterium]|nr:phosphatidate cytidylyltransferase [bacterium]
MLLKRIFTSLIFIPILLFAIFTNYKIPFYILVQGVIILGMWEFFKFSKVKDDNSQIFLGILGGLLLSLSFFIFISTKLILSIILLATLLNSLFKDRIEGAISSCAVTILGIIYISWNLSHLLLIKELVQGKEILFLLFVVTWMSEVFAYGFGTLLGKHKLVSCISPNKTMEGFIAGIIGSVIFSFVIKYFFLRDLPFHNIIIIGVLLGIWGQLGDLVESLFKRDAGVKDSGNTIPGHGGVLDVFDGVIFNAPLLYYLVKYFKCG